MEHTAKRYTAGYQCDGSVDFVKALTRPVIGVWEAPDWEQKPSTFPVTPEFTGFEG